MSSPKPKSDTLDGGVVIPDERVAMDIAALDNVVRGKGVPLIHLRALRCPVGLTDPTDVRRTHADHAGCSNGFLFIRMGRVLANLTTNVTQVQKQDIGWYDGSTVYATFPRFYDSDPKKRVLVRPYDRFYIEQADILTGTWDLTQRRKDEKPDRLEFPAVAVEHLIDSAEQQYGPLDFDVVGGDIVWKPGRGPEPGTVYTAWYQYRPYYYVDRLEHELRLFPVADFVKTDEVRMERLGFAAILQREYVHRTQTEDPQAKRDKDRQALPPDRPDEFGERG